MVDEENIRIGNSANLSPEQLDQFIGEVIKKADETKAMPAPGYNIYHGGIEHGQLYGAYGAAFLKESPTHEEILDAVENPLPPQDTAQVRRKIYEHFGAEVPTEEDFTNSEAAPEHVRYGAGDEVGTIVNQEVRVPTSQPGITLVEYRSYRKFGNEDQSQWGIRKETDSASEVSELGKTATSGRSSETHDPSIEALRDIARKRIIGGPTDEEIRQHLHRANETYPDREPLIFRFADGTEREVISYSLKVPKEEDPDSTWRFWFRPGDPMGTSNAAPSEVEWSPKLQTGRLIEPEDRQPQEQEVKSREYTDAERDKLQMLSRQESDARYDALIIEHAGLDALSRAESISSSIGGSIKRLLLETADPQQRAKLLELWSDFANNIFARAESENKYDPRKIEVALGLANAIVEIEPQHETVQSVAEGLRALERQYGHVIRDFSSKE